MTKPSRQPSERRKALAASGFLAFDESYQVAQYLKGDIQEKTSLPAMISSSRSKDEQVGAENGPLDLRESTSNTGEGPEI